MTDKLSPLFTWRGAIVCSELPPITRHVLSTLTMFMSEAGDSCFPSISTLVDYTGYSRPTVIKAINEGVLAGWLEKKKAGRGGQQWKRNQYLASVPGSFWPYLDQVEKGGKRALPRPILDALEAWRAGIQAPDRTTAAQGQGGKRALPPHSKVVNQVYKGGKAHREKVVNQLYPNRSYNNQEKGSAQKNAGSIFCERCQRNPWTVSTGGQNLCGACFSKMAPGGSHAEI